MTQYRIVKSDVGGFLVERLGRNGRWLPSRWFKLKRLAENFIRMHSQ